jgi:hypothetical protein
MSDSALRSARPASSRPAARGNVLRQRRLLVVACAGKISKCVSYTRSIEGDPIIGMPGSPFSEALLGMTGASLDVSKAVQAFSQRAATAKPSRKMALLEVEAIQNRPQPLGLHCVLDFQWTDLP